MHENICLGYSLEAPRRGASNEYPKHMFPLRNKNILLLFGWKYALSGAKQLYTELSRDKRKRVIGAYSNCVRAEQSKQHRLLKACSCRSQLSCISSTTNNIQTDTTVQLCRPVSVHILRVCKKCLSYYRCSFVDVSLSSFNLSHWLLAF